jgi:hypothetical protein
MTLLFINKQELFQVISEILDSIPVQFDTPRYYADWCDGTRYEEMTTDSLMAQNVICVKANSDLEANILLFILTRIDHYEYFMESFEEVLYDNCPDNDGPDWRLPKNPDYSYKLNTIKSTFISLCEDETLSGKKKNICIPEYTFDKAQILDMFNDFVNDKQCKINFESIYKESLLQG